MRRPGVLCAMGCATFEVQKLLIGRDTYKLTEAVNSARPFETTKKQTVSPKYTNNRRNSERSHN